ncbi:MAG: S8 family serine peptidase [Nitrososphaeria archaeon]
MKKTSFVFFLLIIFLLANPVFARSEKFYFVFENTTIDIELARILMEANIQFNLQDLIDYSNATFIPLLIKYESPVTWGKGSESGKVEDLATYPENLATTETIKSIVHSFNGKFRSSLKTLPYVSIILPRENIKEFSRNLSKSLGGKIKKIEINSLIRLSLNESIPLLQVPSMWNLGLNGSGIKIAIIDTGIDYTHPDFEGRIIKQKCFACYFGNTECGDNDPGYCPDKTAIDDNAMDDHGHGTHCASIAAGSGKASNGLFRGVAPAANLYGIKVLNNWGYGREDDVAKGISWAVENGVHIISLSLGTYGEASLVEDAVNQAIDSGVIVVAAAGNGGKRKDDYFSHIISPASVERVIAVGATFKKDYDFPPYHWEVDQLAPFSSTGPTKDYLIKPDVVAPGAIICAARYDEIFPNGSHPYFYPCYGEKYVQLAGTSMSTPHVAGAVALIKQAHPTWGPEEIRSALVQTAKNLGYSPYEEGGGRINPSKAINASIIITPAIINFGKLESHITSKTKQYLIKNLGNLVYGVRFSFSSKVKNDIDGNEYNLGSSFSMNNFCLNPGENKSIDFSINSIPSQLGYYYGKIIVNIYPYCNFSLPPQNSTLIFGFSRVNILKINYTFAPLPKDVEWCFPPLVTVIFVKENKSEFVHLIAEAEYNKSFIFQYDIFGSDMDVFVNYMEEMTFKNGTTLNRYVFLLNKTNFSSSSFCYLKFDENDARKVITNLTKVFDSKGMNRKHEFWIVSKGGDGRLTWHVAWAGYYAEVGDMFEILVKAYDSYYKDYELAFNNAGIKGKWEDSNETMLLPIYLSYPFTNLAHDIKSSELYAINVTHYDSIKHADTTYWGIAPILPSLMEIYQKKNWGNYLYYATITDYSGSPPPKSKIVWIRAFPNCVYCDYNILTEYWKSSWPKGWMIVDKYLLIQPNKENIPSLITVFEKPFSIDVSSSSSKLRSLIYDKYNKSLVNHYINSQIPTGWLKINGSNLNLYIQNGSWDFECDPTNCLVGDYEFDWYLGLVKDQRLCLSFKANWNGSNWKIVNKNIPSCNPVCDYGNIVLSFYNSTVYNSSIVKVNVSGLQYCRDVPVKIKRDSCNGPIACECSAVGNGCFCEFTAPSEPGNYVYYACIDKNNNGNYNDPGEVDSKTLKVIAPCMGSVSLKLFANEFNQYFLYTTAYLDGLSYCKNKIGYIMNGSCKGNVLSTCWISEKNCSFFFSLSPNKNYTLYACVDKNGDGDFDDTGESIGMNLSIGRPPTLCKNSPCHISSSLITSRDKISPPEPNQPNTVDGCPDGTISLFPQYRENYVHNISIINMNLSSNTFNPGDLIKIEAWVMCYYGDYDTIFFLYANNSLPYEWKLINQVNCPSFKGEIVKVSSKPFVLNNSKGTHAIRVIVIPYNVYYSCGGSTPGMGEYSDNDDVTLLVGQPTSGGGGGGCPYLKVWKNKEFRELGKLYIHSPEEGIDTIYSITFEMEPFEGSIYKLILEEKWYALLEGSHIDFVKLTDENGKECKLIEAKHSKLGNVMFEIEKSDDIRTETKPGDRIELIFTDCSGSKFTFEIEGYNPNFPVLKAILSIRYLSIIISILISIILLIVMGKFLLIKQPRK